MKGFTLVEVLVALTVAGLVLLAAHRVFVGVADSSRALVVARDALDREVNARRWLKATFLSLDPPFDGRVGHVAFDAWQVTPGAWFERRHIELRRDGSRLVALGLTEPLSLADSVRQVEFDYLLDPGVDSKWVREWVSPVSAPLAVRIRIDRGTVDTLLFLIKERG